MTAADPAIDFIVAGVQKGGTTALYAYLNEHPGIGMARIKEAHFFDDETGRIDWADPDYGAYHALFDRGGPEGRRYGEATPIYVYWPNALERILRYNPRIRLILLFRDPVERAYSHWQMEYARGAEREPFAFCIREGRARVGSDPAAPGFHRVFSYVERGFYGSQLRRLFSLFPREQVLVLSSEDLRREPDAVLRRVCRFLEVAEPAGRVEARAVHVARAFDYGAGMSRADEALLRGLYGEEMELFRALSGLSVPGWSA